MLIILTAAAACLPIVLNYVVSLSTISSFHRALEKYKDGNMDIQT